MKNQTNSNHQRVGSGSNNQAILNRKAHAQMQNSKQSNNSVNQAYSAYNQANPASNGPPLNRSYEAN